MKKFKLSDETKTFPCGTVLHRVVATTSFTVTHAVVVDAGNVGGWIEKASNLSDNAWVSGDAMIYGDAEVSGNAWIAGEAHVFGNAQVFDTAQVYGDTQVSGKAWISGNAVISDDARVYGKAWVSDNAWVSDSAKVFGNTLVCDNAWIHGDALVTNTSDYLVFKNNWSSGRYFTWTKSNNKWAVGWFYGTGAELIKKAYADSEDNGKHYESYVTLVETLKDIHIT